MSPFQCALHSTSYLKLKPHPLLEHAWCPSLFNFSPRHLSWHNKNNYAICCTVSFHLFRSYIENNKTDILKYLSGDDDDSGNEEKSSDLAYTSNVEVTGLIVVLDARSEGKQSIKYVFYFWGRQPDVFVVVCVFSHLLLFVFCSLFSNNLWENLKD